MHCFCFFFLSSLDNDFIFIGHFKQCVQCRTTRGVLKIERYGQRLTHRACMGEATPIDGLLVDDTCGGACKVILTDRFGPGGHFSKVPKLYGPSVGCHNSLYNSRTESV